MPLIADSLLENLSLLTRAVELFRKHCIEILVADEARCLELLERSYAFAASYTPLLGYDCVAAVIEKNSDDVRAIKAELNQLKALKQAELQNK